MHRFLLLAAAPLLVAAGPAMDAETRKDLRCFIAVSAMSDQADEKSASSVAIVAQYFLGRIDARAPRLNLEEAIATEAKLITDADFKALVTSCSQTVMQRGNQIMEIGKRLEARGI